MCMPEMDDLYTEFTIYKIEFITEVKEILMFNPAIRNRYKVILDRDASNLHTIVFFNNRFATLARIKINYNHQEELEKECIDIFAEDAKIAEQLKNISCIEKLETTVKKMKEIYQEDQIMVKLKYGL